MYSYYRTAIKHKVFISSNGDFCLVKYDIEEFVDPNYKKMELM